MRLSREYRTMEAKEKETEDGRRSSGESLFALLFSSLFSFVLFFLPFNVVSSFHRHPFSQSGSTNRRSSAAGENSALAGVPCWHKVYEGSVKSVLLACSRLLGNSRAIKQLKRCPRSPLASWPLYGDNGGRSTGAIENFPRDIEQYRPRRRS